jgi:polysaccharide deacetylase 2 family uncharacterized protein YibQ
LLSEQNISSRSIRRTVHRRNGRTIVEERIPVRGNLPFLYLNAALRRGAEDVDARVWTAIETHRAGDRMLVILGGQESITHRLLFTRQPPDSAASRGHPQPKLAVLVFGFPSADGTASRRLLKLPAVLTLSIPPARSEWARQAAARGHEVLIALPMEPKGYPQENPGDGAILVDLKPGEIRRRFDAAARRMPQATGFTPLMGSRVLEDGEVLREVFQNAQKRGLYYADTLGKNRSLAYEEAAASGVPVACWDIVLDGPREETVARAFASLKDIAKKNGSAVGIAHCSAFLVNMLEREIPRMQKEGFQLVPLSRMAQ